MGKIRDSNPNPNPIAGWVSSLAIYFSVIWFSILFLYLVFGIWFKPLAFIYPDMLYAIATILATGFLIYEANRWIKPGIKKRYHFLLSDDFLRKHGGHSYTSSQPDEETPVEKSGISDDDLLDG